MHVFCLQSGDSEVLFPSVMWMSWKSPNLVFYYHALFLFAGCHRKTPIESIFFKSVNRRKCSFRCHRREGEACRLRNNNLVWWLSTGQFPKRYRSLHGPRGKCELFLLYCSCSDKRLAFFKSLFGLQAIKFQPFFLVVVHVSGHPLKWRLLGRVIWGEDWSSDLLW